MTTHSELPDEIWEAIFELATEDERIYATRFPHAMERTEWFPHVEGYWVPRGPSEVIKHLHPCSLLGKEPQRAMGLLS